MPAGGRPLPEAPSKPVVNIADLPMREQARGDKFVAKLGRAGKALGLTKLGCTLTVVPPGKRAWPFHRHHVIEELFYIVSGEGEQRYGNDAFPVKAGDLVAAPAGGEAHQLINTGNEDLRYLAISTIGSVDVLEYPDSGKVSMAAGIKNADFKTATYVGIGRLEKADYWDGEE
jgi:uncharacterized cupin superfamily protein